MLVGHRDASSVGGDHDESVAICPAERNASVGERHQGLRRRMSVPIARTHGDDAKGGLDDVDPIAAQGGLPIKIGDDVVGAAAASGAPGGEKDEACVQTGLDKVKDALK